VKLIYKPGSVWPKSR